MKIREKIKFPKALLCMLFACAFLAVPAMAAESSVVFGTSNTVFETGKTYLVPVELKKASDPEEDSAAKSCVGKYAEFTVDAEGTGKITLNLRAVSMAGMTDYAKDFKIYPNDSASGDLTAAAVEEEKEVSVSAGKKTVPVKISFEIPSAMKAKDGVYLNMWVDIMQKAQNAYLHINYAGAHESDSESYNYVKTGTAFVEQFGKYDVSADVTVQKGLISKVNVTGSGFGGTYEDVNKSKLQQAAKAMADSFTGYYDTDADELNKIDVGSIDGVSGATTSARAIKNAVLDALELSESEEIIPEAPENLEAGTYKIIMRNDTDVVDHSLVGGTKKQEAYLKVDENGNKTLSFQYISGTKEEPLYVLGFNGYYKENDASSDGNLSMEGVKYKKETCGDYEVVTNIEVPLTGKLSAQYYVNQYLYVPAMANLDGNLSGIEFDHGKFNVKSTITLYWDQYEKVTDAGDSAFLEDGVYSVEGKMLKVDKKTASMSDNAITHKIKLTVKNGKYKVTLNFKGMKISGMYGYLKELKYYDTGYTKDGYGNPVGGLKDVSVLSEQKYTDGSLVKDDMGTNYPDIVEIPLIPEALDDGYVPLQVFVPIMDAISQGTGTQNVYLSLDWTSVKDAAENDSIFSEEDVVEEKPAAGNEDQKPGNTGGDNSGATAVKPSAPAAGNPAAKITKNQTVSAAGNTYVVTAVGASPQVTLKKAANKKSVSIPASININGVKALVTGVSDKAFAKSKKKLTSVTIGANVTTIGKKAFAGCKKLKKITIKSKKLKKVGAKAFQGIYKKAVIKVPKQKLKTYKKLLKRKGQKSTVKIK